MRGEPDAFIYKGGVIIMKRLISLLICLTLPAACALAEVALPTEAATSASASAATAAPTTTAAPTAVPAGELFTCDEVRLNLPYGLTLLDEEASAGYEAAVQADFEGAARTLAVAADGNGGMLLLTICDSEADCMTAAAEAARDILGENAAVSEITFGENRCAAFACAIQGRDYRLYLFANGKNVLCVGVSGLSNAQISAALESLRF